MPCWHGGAGYRDEYQRAAYDLVDGWNLVDEYRGQDDAIVQSRLAIAAGMHLSAAKKTP